MSEPDTGNYFTKGEDQPLLTGYILTYGEEGSGKTTLGASLSKYWETPGAKLKDGLLIAWDHGAHDSIRGAGHSMDTINIQAALAKAGREAAIIKVLNNLDKIIPPAAREGREFVLHASLSAADRLITKHHVEENSKREKSDNRQMWTEVSASLTFYMEFMNILFPPPTVHIFEAHASAKAEMEGKMAAADKLKREAEGIMPIMPDLTGKGGALYSRHASLTIHCDVKAGVGKEPDQYVIHPSPGGNYKAKNRFGKALPREMVNATLPQLFALVEKNLRALDGSK